MRKVCIFLVLLCMLVNMGCESVEEQEMATAVLPMISTLTPTFTPVPTPNEQVKPKEQKVQKQDMNKIDEEYKAAYEKAPHFIDLFCKVLNVKKGRVSLIHEYSDENTSCYYIVMNRDDKRNGRYLFRRYKENNQYEYEIWRVWDREKLSHLIKVLDYEYDELAEKIYDSAEKTKKEKYAPKRISIDDSTVIPYEESLYGTDDIWECWNGYINETGEFAVSYLQPSWLRWKRGVFRDGNWEMRAVQNFEGIVSCEYGIVSSENTIWCNTTDSTVMKLYDDKGKKLHTFDTKAWCEKNGIKGKLELGVIISKTEMLFYNYKTKDSYWIDCATGKLKKKFKNVKYNGGIYENGKLYCFVENAEEETKRDYFQEIDLKTGKRKLCLDLSAIYEDNNQIVEYYALETNDYSLTKLKSWNIKGTDDGEVSCNFNVQKGEIYFQTNRGVYHYNKKEKELEKILDGDDEGPLDFLVLKPEEGYETAVEIQGEVNAGVDISKE